MTIGHAEHCIQVFNMTIQFITVIKTNHFQNYLIVYNDLPYVMVR